MLVDRATSPHALKERRPHGAVLEARDALPARPAGTSWNGLPVTAYGVLGLERAWSLLGDCLAMSPLNWAEDEDGLPMLMAALDKDPGGDGDDRAWSFLSEHGDLPVVAQITLDCAAIVLDAAKAQSAADERVLALKAKILPKSATLRAAAFRARRDEAVAAAIRIAAFLSALGRGDLATEALGSPGARARP